MKVSGGIRIDIAAADGFTVSLSKYAHSYGVTADGTLKESLDTGLIKVSVKNGKTQLICPSTTTTQPSTNGTYKVTSIVMGAGMTVSKSISGNQFVFWPASYTAAGQVTMNLTIVAMWEGVDYTFTQEVTFSKTSDGQEGSNYLYMGWWNPDVTYSKTDLGIPLVKKADGTDLGYSVYALKVAASTPGSFILSEWDLVESADFIYMQQAYIERLQAEIVTAQKIESLLLQTGNLEVTDGASIGDFTIENGKLVVTYSWFTYVGSNYVQVTQKTTFQSSGVLVEASYGGTVDHPQVVSWNAKFDSGGVTIGSMELRRDGLYRNGFFVI